MEPLFQCFKVEPFCCLHWHHCAALHFVCVSCGVDVVRFDNTYSWTKAKVVHYLVRVEEPGDKEPVSPTASQDAVAATASREAAAAAATVADV